MTNRAEPNEADDGGAEPNPSWVSDQVTAMAAAWGKGEPISAAALIEQHPEIDTEAAIRLIYEEVCLKRESGIEVRTSEVIRNYPRWKDDLIALFDCDRLLRTSTEAIEFPEIGESIGPFRLLEELGRGASGRTFLAIDPSLADRAVVVKVIPDDQEEHLALARLRHTHIVPLFSEHAFPDRGLRLLCMPYLGGASLAQILTSIQESSPSEITGRRLNELIDLHTRTHPAPPPPEGPFRRRIEQESYAEAIIWIVSCLADALHYAHARGLVHMDIKPSNVLITVDGQPMLLDFHLARPPISAGDWVLDRLGGTPGWMSPEQAAAMEAVSEGAAISVAVDARTDIYALGLLLREALLAPVRNREKPARNVQLSKLGVSVGLEDILNKCLAKDPLDRYHNAALLAEDLRRHFNNEPLRGVSNRSIGERWTKWRRRRPGALAWACTAVATIAVGVGLWLVYTQEIRYLQQSLQLSRDLAKNGEYQKALTILEHARSVATRRPGTNGLLSNINDEIAIQLRSSLAVDLHKRAERFRFRHGSTLPRDEEARGVLRECETIWARRDVLLKSGESPDQRLNLSMLKDDLREIAIVWADLLLSLSGQSPSAATKQRIVAILAELQGDSDQAISIPTRLKALLPPGKISSGQLPQESLPADHYHLGRDLLREARFDLARREFAEALRQIPDDFWSNFYEGECAFRLGLYAEAVSAYRTCIALNPRSAICYFNRAVSLEAMGDSEGAGRDYTQAFDLDPKFAKAVLNRGILRFRANQLLEAAADFAKAGKLADDRETQGKVEYNLAVVYDLLGDRVTALRHAELAVSYGLAVAESLRLRLRSSLEGPPAKRLIPLGDSGGKQDAPPPKILIAD